MRLDIRIPVGALLLILGALLAAYGAATRGDASLYQRSLDIDINLYWGGAMAVAGTVFLVLARRGSRGSR
jgi:hypothetical protein